MAKRTSTPAKVKKPDQADLLLHQLAEMLLGDHFFDPESELAYKRVLAENRPAATAGIVLAEETIEVSDTTCTVRIEALRTWTQLRVALAHPAFTAAIEGDWSFDNEELRAVKVTRTGKADIVETIAEALIEAVDGGGLDDGEFAGFLQDLEDDGEAAPLIGDDPAEPPEATALERNRMKAIVKRLARKPDAELNVEDRGWLEQTPQLLPVMTEALISAIQAVPRNEATVEAYGVLLSLQLEFVRYRQDRGWDWATKMLESFQEKLVSLGEQDAIPRDDWFKMCSALAEARVPVADPVQTALANAGFKAEERDGPPEEMLRMLRQFMDELARMISSPFEVIEALQNSGAMLPAMLRSFMATELALSPHQNLRDAVPLLLLDDDSSVRMAAAGALEQTAHPDTLSPAALRRAITVRNWLPVADRPALDSAIRKARVAGVETSPWPEPVRDLEFHASVIDGSGAQSILGISRVGKKGLFAGLLVRHGTGIVDGWADRDVARGKISKLLREAQMAAASLRVDRTFIDTMVQHAISASVAQGTVPPSSLLDIAEVFGCTEWKDRGLDIKAEADRFFQALDRDDRSPEGIQAGFARGLEWLSEDEVFGTWFEDGPQVQKALAKLSRTDRIGMTEAVMTDILPGRRMEWAERFLMLAMWYQAAADAKHRSKARDLVLVAHALAGDEPLGGIPVMSVIAIQTVRATLLGAW